jgi:hypothetical protein
LYQKTVVHVVVVLVWCEMFFKRESKEKYAELQTKGS